MRISRGYSYARADVTGKGLANAYSQTLGQVFAHEVKPYEIDIVVAEVGPTVDDDQIFRIQFDGTLRDARTVAVLGADEDDIASGLADRFDGDTHGRGLGDRRCLRRDRSRLGWDPWSRVAGKLPSSSEGSNGGRSGG